MGTILCIKEIIMANSCTFFTGGFNKYILMPVNKIAASLNGNFVKLYVVTVTNAAAIIH
jgi:hypothetical protein